MRSQHSAPPQRTTARQRGAGQRSGIVLRRISPDHRDKAVEFGHLPGPGDSEKGRSGASTLLPQCRSASHRHALARALGPSGAEVLLQSHRLHAEAGHCEAGLQPHVDTIAVQRHLEKLQARRAVRQRQEAQLVPSGGNACGSAVRPGRQQQAAV